MPRGALKPSVPSRRARSEPDGTRWRTGGEVKGKLANGVGSQYSQANSERGLSSITQADAHTSAASSRLNWRPHRFKWTRPFRGKTKSGFCACAIMFRTSCTCLSSLPTVMNKLARSYDIILQFARVLLLCMWIGLLDAVNLIFVRLYVYHFYKENRHNRISKIVWELRSSGLLRS